MWGGKHDSIERSNIFKYGGKLLQMIVKSLHVVAVVCVLYMERGRTTIPKTVARKTCRHQIQNESIFREEREFISLCVHIQVSFCLVEDLFTFKYVLLIVQNPSELGLWLHEESKKIHLPMSTLLVGQLVGKSKTFSDVWVTGTLFDSPTSTLRLRHTDPILNRRRRAGLWSHVWLGVGC